MYVAVNQGRWSEQRRACSHHHGEVLSADGTGSSPLSLTASNLQFDSPPFSLTEYLPHIDGDKMSA